MTKPTPHAARFSRGWRWVKPPCIDMKGPDGTVYPMARRFVEFYPPYRFHTTTGPLNAEGKLMFECWTSVFFEEVEGGTEVVLDVHVMELTDEAPKHLKDMRQGWSESLDRLAALLTNS